MNKIRIAFVILPILAGGASLHAAGESRGNVNLLTGEGVSLGDIFFPAVNFQSSFGSSTANPGALVSGHHDPDRNGFNVQALELALDVKPFERFTLHGRYALKPDLDDRWEAVFEEYFATVSGLPFGGVIRGGRFLSKFGMHNQNHPHGFAMVDQHIANGRILGEDGLTLEGGEISLPVLRSLPAGWEDRLTVALGRVAHLHDHDHGHDHGGGAHEDEAEFESDGGLLRGWATTANYELTFAATSRTLHTAGVSGAWGRNRYGRSSQIYGVNYEYLWREGGALNRIGHRETSE